MSRSSEVHAAGPDAIVTRRGTGSDAAQLRATGERLIAAAHPGVVEVVSSMGTTDHWELQLVHAGRPIDLVGPLSVEQSAGATAAVATVLADLHAVGIVHGSIDGSHVLIGPHGRPVLCGFGAPMSVPARPEDDVAALGTLIAGLLSSDAELEPAPGRRVRRHASWNGWARRSLLLVADLACAEPPTRRPSARRLACAIAEAVPGAVAVRAPLPGDPPPREPAPLAEPAPVAEQAPVPQRSHDVRPASPLDMLRRTGADETARPPRISALLYALLGVLALGAASLRLAQPDATSPAAAGLVAPSAPSSSLDPSDPEPLLAAPGAVAPADSVPTTTIESGPPASCRTRQLSPPGCVDHVTIDGTTVVIGARRYEVGQRGDLVVVGDWDGDGLRTAAVLRPTTGEVFVFSAWAADDDVVVRPLATVDGAAALLVTDAGDRDKLVVRRSDGSRYPIPTGATA